MSIARELPTAHLAYLEPAFETCARLPADVRARIGCELLAVRRAGLGSSWEPCRHVLGAVILTAREAAHHGWPATYRMVCATVRADALVIVHAFAQVLRRGETEVPAKALAFTRARLRELVADHREHRAPEAARVTPVPLGDDVLAALGFAPEDARLLTHRAERFLELRQRLRRHGYSRLEGRAIRAILDGDLGRLEDDALDAMHDLVSRREA